MTDTLRGLYHFIGDRTPKELDVVPPKPCRENPGVGILQTQPSHCEFIDDYPALKPSVRMGLLPAVAMSTVAVNTTLAEKVAIVGSLALVSFALAVWLNRRRGKDIIS